MAIGFPDDDDNDDLPETVLAKPLIIDDDEEQDYVLTLKTKTPTEGTAFTVELTASPEHEDGASDPMQVNIDKTSGWTLNVAGENPETENNDATESHTTVGSGANGTRTIVITQTDGDKNRVADDVTVSAHTGVAGASSQVDSLTISVADGDALQKVGAQFVDKDGGEARPAAHIGEGGRDHLHRGHAARQGRQADQRPTRNSPSQ